MLDAISPPLLDRCEVIQLSGYSHNGLLHIAPRFLLPKRLAQNGMSEEHVQLNEPALLCEVTPYARVASVRGMVASCVSRPLSGRCMLVPGDYHHRHNRPHLPCQTPAR